MSTKKITSLPKQEQAPEPKQEPAIMMKPCMICNRDVGTNELEVYVFCKGQYIMRGVPYDMSCEYKIRKEIFKMGMIYEDTKPCIICGKVITVDNLLPQRFCKTIECVSAYKELHYVEHYKNLVKPVKKVKFLDLV